jgi:hypothetical protein
VIPLGLALLAIVLMLIRDRTRPRTRYVADEQMRRAGLANIVPSANLCERQPK